MSGGIGRKDLVTERSWGDGGGDRRPHVIEDIKLTGEDQWAKCAVCQVVVPKGDFLTMEAAWNNHRGVAVNVGITRAMKLASDSEVRDFFRRLDPGAYHESGIDLIDTAWRPSDG